MTPKQAKALVRSLQHRNRLAQRIPDLEAQLTAIVEARGPCIIGGYKISLTGGDLSIDPIEIVPLHQLAFDFVRQGGDHRADTPGVSQVNTGTV